MPATVPTKKLIVRYKGIFDMEGLYRVIVQWLKSKRYWFHESTYKHKVPTPHGAEEEIKFAAERKVDEYHLYNINMYFHLWHITEVEVIKDGKKKKLTKGQIEIQIKGELVLDYQGRFDKSPFFQALRGFYHKYLIKDKLENVWYDTLYYRTLKLQALIKDYLDIEAKSHEYEGYMGDNV